MSKEYSFAEFRKDKKFLQTGDFLFEGVYRQRRLTVKKLHPPKSVKASNGRIVELPVLEFEETKKMFPVNVTNLTVLHMTCGDITSKFVLGARITLNVAYGMAFGEEAAFIRLRPPAGAKLSVGVRRQLGKDLTGTRVQAERKPTGEVEVVPTDEGS